MIKDGNYDEIKDSVIETLGWSALGLCLAVIKTLQEIDVWVYRWTNNDDPLEVFSNVEVYLTSHPDNVYPAIKSVLKEYNLDFMDWEWAAIKFPPIFGPSKNQAKWTAVLTFRSSHKNWTENDPPPGGHRSASGWQYEPEHPKSQIKHL